MKALPTILSRRGPLLQRISCLCLITAMVTLGSAALTAWLCTWPPTDTGTWHWASPLIAVATLIGWACLPLPLFMGAAERLSRYGSGSNKRAPDYREIVRHRAGVCLCRFGLPLHMLAGCFLLPSALFDLGTFLFPDITPDLAIFALTARGLYAIGLMAGFLACLFVIFLIVDLGCRLRYVDIDTSERFTLAAVTDPVVADYRRDIETMGRRLLIEDRKRLGAHLKLDGSVSHDH